jgi:hypothetical protein
MARIGWKFEDPIDGTVQIMSINPNEGASPSFRKTLTKMTTTAPGAGRRALVFEGADEISQFDFSGVLLTKEHYDFILNAWRSRHILRVTDDLGRVFMLYIESFEPRRLLSRTYPWRHEYSATSVVVG